jgi:hypothetical protein
MEDPNVPDLIRRVAESDLESPLAVDDVSYFLSTIEISVGDRPGMTRWRKRLFVATAGITADAAEYFGLPAIAPSSWAPASRSSSTAREMTRPARRAFRGVMAGITGTGFLTFENGSLAS